MSDKTDFFDDAIQPSNGKRGRPKHLATAKNRNKVMVLFALGWSQTRISNALHISPKTLRRHYFTELSARNQALDKILAVYELSLNAQLLEGWFAGRTPQD